MAAPVISISSDVSVKIVGSSFPRVILISSISVEVLVAPEVGAAIVASPAEVLELDTHSSSEADPSESSPPPVSVAPMVSPFLWRSRYASRSSSPTTSTLEIPTAPTLPAPSAIVAPSSEFPLALVVAPPRIRRQRAILIRPEEDIPISRLYRTYPGGPRRALTMRKSVRPLPSHRLALRSFIIWAHASPDTTVTDSSSPLKFVHPPLTRTPRCSEVYLHWRSPATTMTSFVYATRALVPSRADLLPPHKRFRDSISPEDSVEEDIDTDVLEDIEADATVVEVAVDRDVVTGIDAGIDIEVDVGIDVEDEVKSSDRGTMKVGVDVAARIDIFDALLMPDAVERLEQVEEGLQDIYEHVIDIPLQRIKDIKKGQRELESRSLIAGGERASLLD
ncbi:hypothetical protein Tco_0622499 [Tanacetum coccineum]